jgi:hypothetical protein
VALLLPSPNSSPPTKAFVSKDINFTYVFSECNLFAVFFVYIFLLETMRRPSEEIHILFLLEAEPWSSRSWIAPEGEDLIVADQLMLNSKGATGIGKKAGG